jgi:hypothetical protein
MSSSLVSICPKKQQFFFDQGKGTPESVVNFALVCVAQNPKSVNFIPLPYATPVTF